MILWQWQMVKIYHVQNFVLFSETPCSQGWFQEGRAAAVPSEILPPPNEVHDN